MIKLRQLDVRKLKSQILNSPERKKAACSLDISPILDKMRDRAGRSLHMKVLKVRQYEVRQPTVQHYRHLTEVKNQKFRSQPDLNNDTQVEHYNNNFSILSDVEQVIERPRNVMEQTFGIQLPLLRRRFPKDIFHGNVSKVKKQFQI